MYFDHLLGAALTQKLDSFTAAFTSTQINLHAENRSELIAEQAKVRKLELEKRALEVKVANLTLSSLEGRDRRESAERKLKDMTLPRIMPSLAVENRMLRRDILGLNSDALDAAHEIRHLKEANKNLTRDLTQVLNESDGHDDGVFISCKFGCLKAYDRHDSLVRHKKWCDDKPDNCKKHLHRLGRGKCYICQLKSKRQKKKKN